MGGVILMAAPGGESALGPLLPELYDIVWSAVIFAVILFVVARFGVPRMNRLLDARSAAIEGNIQQAQTAQREANEALERYNAQLADARVEAGKIRDQAREDAKRIRAEAQGQAQADAERIVAQGNAQVEANRAKAEADLRAGVGALALRLASGILGEHLENDEHSTAYVDRFLADLEIEHGAAR